MTSAPAIAAPGEGPPAPCGTVPETVPGAVTSVFAVAESFAVFGSGVSVVTEAVLLTDPPGAVTLTTSVNVTPCHSAGREITSRVVPAMAVTMERREFVMRLKRVDLPTFGRPTSTTVGPDAARFKAMRKVYLARRLTS